LNRAERGTLEVAEQHADGLDGLDGFDYAWLLSWLDDHDTADEPPPLRQVPFLLRPASGGSACSRPVARGASTPSG
jgi:tRNA (adenine37-N6)-methyltransferase